MFLLKKLLAPLLFPLPICILLIGAGLVLLWFSRRQKAGKIIVTSGFVILVVLSYGLVAGPLLRTLEHAVPPPSEESLALTKWIVVLGGGSFLPTRPVTSRANATTLARLVEGIRLQRQLPSARLLLSGGAVFAAGSDAQSMKAIAIALGVPPASIVLEEESLDTEMQAVNVARIVKDEPLVVVTSAYHMPRTMGLFNKAGLRPVAAPAHYLTGRRTGGFAVPDLYPTTAGLSAAQTVENEYLGMAWSRMRGRM